MKNGPMENFQSELFKGNTFNFGKYAYFLSNLYEKFECIINVPYLFCGRIPNEERMEYCGKGKIRPLENDKRGFIEMITKDLRENERNLPR